VHPYIADPDPIRATAELRRDLVSLHDFYGLPIWVTEYAVADWSKQGDPYAPAKKQAEFAAESVRMMNKLPFVKRYAWYVAMPDTSGATEPCTCDARGNNTAVGKAYADAK